MLPRQHVATPEQELGARVDGLAVTHHTISIDKQAGRERDNGEWNTPDAGMCYLCSQADLFYLSALRISPSMLFKHPDPAVLDNEWLGGIAQLLGATGAHNALRRRQWLDAFRRLCRVQREITLRYVTLCNARPHAKDVRRHNVRCRWLLSRYACRGSRDTEMFCSVLFIYHPRGRELVDD